MSQMAKIAVANQKGGVGKSTIARNLVFYLMEQGLRVLAVDTDPQGNFSKTLLSVRERHYGESSLPPHLTAAQLFEEADSDLEPVDVGHGSGLIRATRDLVDVSALPIDSLVYPRDRLTRFSSRYDVCVIDTAPTLGSPLYAALIMTDFVVCPCTMDDDAIEGLTELFTDIGRVQEIEGWNPELQPLGVLANIVKKHRSYDLAAVESLKAQLGDLLFDAVVYDRAATHYTKDRPVWQSIKGADTRTVAAIEMKAACLEVCKRAGITIKSNKRKAK